MSALFSDLFFKKDELDGVDLIPHSVAGVYALLFCLLKRLPYRLFFVRRTYSIIQVCAVVG